MYVSRERAQLNANVEPCTFKLTPRVNLDLSINLICMFFGLWLEALSMRREHTHAWVCMLLQTEGPQSEFEPETPFAVKSQC